MTYIAPKEPLTKRCFSPDTAPPDELLGKAKKAFWSRLWNIILMAAIIMVLAYFVLMFGYAIHDAITEYNAMVNSAPNKSGATVNTLFDRANDNEVYKAQLAPGESATSDYAQYKAYMENVKQTYSEYNKTIKDHTINVMGKEPQDIVDERIMLREYDNYA